MSEIVNFELVLKTAAGLPMVKIDREKYLRTALKQYYSSDIIDKAIEHNPAYAGISVDDINKIAKGSINYETIKVSGLSFASGLPGGMAMAATIPADLTQYFGHILRILQKLIYLYGWKDLYSEDGNMNDETANLITLFIGIMFGVNGAGKVINKVSASAAQRVAKNLAHKPLTKGIIYPIVKKIAQVLGIKMTREIFAKGVSKLIPVIGGVVSGSLTLLTYRPMAEKLRKYLATLPCADVNYYSMDSDKTIDLELDEEFVESVIIDVDSEIKSAEEELFRAKKKHSLFSHH